ncbi:unnamed protein product [Lasius platythorax]|uniref:Uncharacterized protein n=1 Tax=Lasius platythorax TaxID=488582 RepID=A0AAV2N2M9_9HYME
MPALKAVEKRSASPPSVRVAAACNTCNTSDRDEEEACSDRWRAELREDRVLNDFALCPLRAVLPPPPALTPLFFFWYGSRASRRTLHTDRRYCIMHGLTIFSERLGRVFSELPYKPRKLRVLRMQFNESLNQ